MNSSRQDSTIRRWKLAGKAGLLSVCALSAAAWGQTGGIAGANPQGGAGQGAANAGAGAQAQPPGGQFTPRTGGTTNNGAGGTANNGAGATNSNGTTATPRPGRNRPNGGATAPNAGPMNPAAPNGTGSVPGRNNAANGGNSSGNASTGGNNNSAAGNNNRNNGGANAQNNGSQNTGANGQNRRMTANALGARIEATPDGLVVRNVKPGSPAALAGLREGDLISGIGGTPVQTQADLDRLLSTFPLGSTIDFAGLRNGQLVTSPVVLPQTIPGTGTTTTTTQSNQSNSGRGQNNGNSSDQAMRELLPSDIGWELQEKDRRVWITSVTPGLFADDAGFKEGDLITQIDKTDITKAAAAQYKLSTVEPGMPALVKIERDKVPMTIRLQVPSAPVTTVADQGQQQGGGQQSQSATTTTVEAARPNLLRAELIRRLEIQEEILKKSLVELQTIRAELETTP